MCANATRSPKPQHREWQITTKHSIKTRHEKWIIPSRLFIKSMAKTQLIPLQRIPHMTHKFLDVQTPQQQTSKASQNSFLGASKTFRFWWQNPRKNSENSRVHGKKLSKSLRKFCREHKCCKFCQHLGCFFWAPKNNLHASDLEIFLRRLLHRLKNFKVEPPAPVLVSWSARNYAKAFCSRSDGSDQGRTNQRCQWRYRGTSSRDRRACRMRSTNKSRAHGTSQQNTLTQKTEHNTMPCTQPCRTMKTKNSDNQQTKQMAMTKFDVSDQWFDIATTSTFLHTLQWTAEPEINLKIVFLSLYKLM